MSISNFLDSVVLAAVAKMVNAAWRRRSMRRGNGPACNFVAEAIEPRTLLSGYSFSSLASFTGYYIADPNALTIDANGNFFGTTYNGGAYGTGAVFEIPKGSTSVTSLASFSNVGVNGTTSISGADPHAVLTLDASGDLFGTTSGGGSGSGGDGTVFEIPSGSSSVISLASFTGDTGTLPGNRPGALTIDASGNLFGTTYGDAGPSNGNNVGTVFEIPRGSTSVINVASFTGNTGTLPGWGPGPLTLDSSGNLLGTTVLGGSSGDGTVFEIPSGSTAATSFASFTGSTGTQTGAEPIPALTLDASGNLFGATTPEDTSGGPDTVFEIAKGSTAVVNVATLPGVTGVLNNIASILPVNGNLFGTTNAGDGSVFEIPNGSTSAITLATFTGTSGTLPGEFPQNLTLDTNGNIFGTTAGGGASNDGTLFEIPAGSTGVSSMASFTGDAGTLPGAFPFASLTIDSSGNLFGTTESGGGIHDGTVFEIANGSNSVTNVLSFVNAGALPGDIPGATLSVDASENVFGTTGDPTVFEIGQGSTAVTNLASFPIHGSGNFPVQMTLDARGNLIATSLFGGSEDVLEIPMGSTSPTVLASFTGATGALPGDSPASLTLDASGDVIGTTAYGGSSGDGTVFEVPSGSTSVISLASFTGNSGALPGSFTGFSGFGGLALDASGDLFGTTDTGGSSGDGTVFEIPAGSTSVINLASFTGDTGPLPGKSPRAALSLDASGNLFGTTYLGGSSGDGTVFEIPKASTSVTYVASFNGNAGALPGENPGAAMTLDSSGNLFGTTYTGGSSNEGTVFEIPAGSHSVSHIVNFTGGNGAYPAAAMTLDASGNLFGTTHLGGTGFGGIVFEIPKGSTSLIKLAEFTGIAGNLPGAEPGTLSLTADGSLFGTTAAGGSSNAGTVFEITRRSISFTANTKALAGAVVGNVGTDGMPAADALTYSLSAATDGGTNPAAFAISSAGVMTIANPAYLPHATTTNPSPVATFNLTVTDTVTGVITNTPVTVNLVAGTAMAPIVLHPTLNLFRVATAAPTGAAATPVGTVTATRAYTGQIIHYLIADTGSTTEPFAINSTTGAITTTGALAAGQTYTFAITVADSMDATTSATIAVTLSIGQVGLTNTALAVAVNDNVKTTKPLSGVTITDGAAADHVTVTVSINPVFGSLAGTGFVAGSTAGTYVLSGVTAAVASADIHTLTFTPIAHLVAPGISNAVPVNVTITDTTVPTGTNGATLVDDAATVMTVTAVNSAPVIAGPFIKAGAAVATYNANNISDHRTATPFPNVTITDQDVSNTVPVSLTNPAVPQMLTATISYPAANGTLAESAGFSGPSFILSGVGVYSVSGSASQVTAAIRALVFTPTLHQVAIGTTKSTTFTIKVTDGVVSTPATNSLTTVIAKATGFTAALTSATLKATAPSAGHAPVVANTVSLVTLKAADMTSGTFTYSFVSGANNNSAFAFGSTTATANQLYSTVFGGLPVGVYTLQVQATDGTATYTGTLTLTIGTSSSSVTPTYLQ